MQLYSTMLDTLTLIRMDRSRGRMARFWFGLREAKQFLRRERYDLMVAQDVEHALLAWYLSKRNGVPFQMQIHTDIFSPYFWKGGLLNKLRVLCAVFLVPRASCIRVVSRRIQNSLEARYPDKHLAISVLPIIPAIITDDSAKLASPLKTKDFTVLMVARLEKEKNIPLALRVFARFLKEQPHARMHITGSGSQEAALKCICTALGIEHKVVFQKTFSTQEYQTADVLLLTSNYEGYALVALEALHSGLPVIMTDVGVAGEVVQNCVNGLVVPVKDEERLLQALIEFAGDSVLQERLRQGAKATPLPYASPEEYRDKLVTSWKTCTN